MSSPHGKSQKAPIVDISDSSSQASEDNVLPREPPRANRVALHYAAENPDKPDARANGQYGLFSQCSPLSSHLPTKTLAKRKKVSGSNKEMRNTSRLKKKKNKRPETNKMSRGESPLFEPEESWGVQIQDDIDAGAVMLSPPSIPASESRLPMRKESRSAAVAISTSRSKRPSLIKTKPSSFVSNCDFGSDASSNIVVSTKPCPVMTAPSTKPDFTTKILQGFLDISPLSVWRLLSHR